MKRDLFEARISNADVSAIFKDASELRNKSGGFDFFKKNKAPKISFNDLQKAWAKGVNDGEEEVEGYSNDTRDIKYILQQFGFSDKEINKVFSQVFSPADQEQDDEDDYEEPHGIETVEKIAEYAKKAGLADALKRFLEREFADELGIKESATYEEIRRIFENILNEERTNLELVVQREELQRFGRHRK